MKKFVVDTYPKEFQDWLNHTLQLNQLDIDTNRDVIFEIINSYQCQLDTLENRERFKYDLLNQKNVKSIKSIRREKIMQINDISNGYKR